MAIKCILSFFTKLPKVSKVVIPFRLLAVGSLFNFSCTNG